jgi:hypothetical protein
MTLSDSKALAHSAGPESQDEIAHDSFELAPEKRVVSWGVLGKVGHGASEQWSKKRVA